MNNEAFRHLMRGLCTTTGIADVDEVLETGSLAVGGIAFSVYAEDDTEGPAADALMVYCDYGMPPEKDQLAVVRRLLEINLYLADGPCIASYSLNPETGHIVLACRFRISELTPAGLAEILDSCAREARQWSATHYLDPRPVEMSAPAYNALAVVRRRH